jgi:hypothetical protein
LPRTEPIRSWSTLFGSARDPSQTSEAKAGAPRASDPISRGVEMGYRVIDEYVRQGAAVASSFSGNSAKGAAGADLSQLAERMLRYASDFSAAWLEAMTMMAASVGSATGNSAKVNDVTNDSNSSRAWPAELRVSVELRSKHPAEISLSLEGSAPGEQLELEPLRVQAGKTTIEDVVVELPTEATGAIRVKVNVPTQCKRGRYTGAILEAQSGKPRGRLTVIVGPDPGT